MCGADVNGRHATSLLLSSTELNGNFVSAEWAHAFNEHFYVLLIFDDATKLISLQLCARVS